MKFLMFWGISSILCCILVYILAKGIKNEVRREYDGLSNEKGSLTEILSAFVLYFLPLLNIVFVVCGYFTRDKLKEDMIHRNNLTKKPTK